MGRIPNRDGLVSHEQAILHFLYDEGPSTCDQVAGHLGLSSSRTSDILGMMRQAGLVEYRRLGQPPNVYWLLYEDAVAA